MWNIWFQYSTTTHGESKKYSGAYTLIKEGEEFFYYLTAYFRNPKTICDESVGSNVGTIGDRLVFYAGKDGQGKDTFIEAPLTQDAAVGTKWVKGRCFSFMGKNRACVCVCVRALCFKNSKMNRFLRFYANHSSFGHQTVITPLFVTTQEFIIGTTSTKEWSVRIFSLIFFSTTKRKEIWLVGVLQLVEGLKVRDWNILRRLQLR